MQLRDEVTRDTSDEQIDWLLDRYAGLLTADERKLWWAHLQKIYNGLSVKTAAVHGESLDARTEAMVAVPSRGALPPTPDNWQMFVSADRPALLWPQPLIELCTQAWAAARDEVENSWGPMVRWAVGTGMSKSRLHQLTGMSRATIDRYLDQPNQPSRTVGRRVAGAREMSWATIMSRSHHRARARPRALLRSPVMNTDDWTAVGAIAAAAGVVVTAVMAYWTTRKAAAAAANSARTAEEVAQIERDRWHRELTPELTFRLIRVGPNTLWLSTTLDGPVGLDHLDTITLTVRDEAEVDHSPGPHLTDEQRVELQSVIWGPARFTPGVDGVAAPGRQSVIRALERGEGARRQLENSAPPSWFRDIADWVDGYWDTPLRLQASCERAGDKPWIVVAEVANPGMEYHPDGSEEMGVPEQYR
ncbi:hypothetical protein ACWDRR_33070 [Kitasatospora sp. NPDC003701]